MKLLKAIGEAFLYLLLVCFIGAIMMALNFLVMTPLLGGIRALVAWVGICFVLVVMILYLEGNTND